MLQVACWILHACKGADNHADRELSPTIVFWTQLDNLALELIKPQSAFDQAVSITHYKHGWPAMEANGPSPETLVKACGQGQPNSFWLQHHAVHHRSTERESTTATGDPHSGAPRR